VVRGCADDDDRVRAVGGDREREAREGEAGVGRGGRSRLGERGGSLAAATLGELGHEFEPEERGGGGLDGSREVGDGPTACEHAETAGFEPEDAGVESGIAAGAEFRSLDDFGPFGEEAEPLALDGAEDGEGGADLLDGGRGEGEDVQAVGSPEADLIGRSGDGSVEMGADGGGDGALAIVDDPPDDLDAALRAADDGGRGDGSGGLVGVGACARTEGGREEGGGEQGSCVTAGGHGRG